MSPFILVNDSVTCVDQLLGGGGGGEVVRWDGGGGGFSFEWMARRKHRLHYAACVFFPFTTHTTVPVERRRYQLLRCKLMMSPPGTRLFYKREWTALIRFVQRAECRS